MPARALSRPSSAADGRTRRGERSGDAIVAALYELIGAGILDPTAQQVAARARVGLRTVFRRFSDKERLFAELDARLLADARPLLRAAEPRGTLAARATALVARRVAFFERIGPYKRAGNVKRWRSPFIAARHAELVRVLRADLLHWLPELRGAPAAALDAVELATSFEAWDRLRSEQKLSRGRAQAAVERAVLALLPARAG
jgi:AcrR family transcriptional regulator